MRQFIVRILKRCPILYRCVSKVYWALNFRHLQERIIGTKARENYWAGRSIGAGYWANRDVPMVRLLAERIAALAPVRSILEIGCASGPNLYHLAKKFPEAQLKAIFHSE